MSKPKSNQNWILRYAEAITNARARGNGIFDYDPEVDEVLNELFEEAENEQLSDRRIN